MDRRSPGASGPSYRDGGDYQYGGVYSALARSCDHLNYSAQPVWRGVVSYDSDNEMGRRRDELQRFQNGSSVFYSKQDMREQYCLSDLQLSGLEKRRSRSIFTCFTDKKSRVGAKVGLLSSCYRRESETRHQAPPRTPPHLSVDVCPLPPPDMRGQFHATTNQFTCSLPRNRICCRSATHHVSHAGMTVDLIPTGCVAGYMLEPSASDHVYSCECYRPPHARYMCTPNPEWCQQSAITTAVPPEAALCSAGFLAHPSCCADNRQLPTAGRHSAAGNKHVSFDSQLYRSQTLSNMDHQPPRSDANPCLYKNKSQERLLDTRTPDPCPPEHLHIDPTYISRELLNEKVRRSTQRSQSTQTDSDSRQNSQDHLRNRSAQTSVRTHSKQEERCHQSRAVSSGRREHQRGKRPSNSVTRPKIVHVPSHEESSEPIVGMIDGEILIDYKPTDTRRQLHKTRSEGEILNGMDDNRGTTRTVYTEHSYIQSQAYPSCSRAPFQQQMTNRESRIPAPQPSDHLVTDNAFESSEIPPPLPPRDYQDAEEFHESIMANMIVKSAIQINPSFSDTDDCGTHTDQQDHSLSRARLASSLSESARSAAQTCSDLRYARQIGRDSTNFERRSNQQISDNRCSYSTPEQNKNSQNESTLSTDIEGQIIGMSDQALQHPSCFVNHIDSKKSQQVVANDLSQLAPVSSTLPNPYALESERSRSTYDNQTNESSIFVNECDGVIPECSSSEVAKDTIVRHEPYENVKGPIGKRKSTASPELIPSHADRSFSKTNLGSAEKCVDSSVAPDVISDFSEKDAKPLPVNAKSRYSPPNSKDTADLYLATSQPNQNNADVKQAADGITNDVFRSKQTKSSNSKKPKQLSRYFEENEHGELVEVYKTAVIGCARSSDRSSSEASSITPGKQRSSIDTTTKPKRSEKRSSRTRRTSSSSSIQEVPHESKKLSRKNSQTITSTREGNSTENPVEQNNQQQTEAMHTSAISKNSGRKCRSESADGTIARVSQPNRVRFAEVTLVKSEEMERASDDLIDKRGEYTNTNCMKGDKLFMKVPDNNASYHDRLPSTAPACSSSKPETQINENLKKCEDLSSGKSILVCVSETLQAPSESKQSSPFKTESEESFHQQASSDQSVNQVTQLLLSEKSMSAMKSHSSVTSIESDVFEKEHNSDNDHQFSCDRSNMMSIDNDATMDKTSNIGAILTLHANSPCIDERHSDKSDGSNASIEVRQVCSTTDLDSKTRDHGSVTEESAISLEPCKPTNKTSSTRPMYDDVRIKTSAASSDVSAVDSTAKIVATDTSYVAEISSGVGAARTTRLTRQKTIPTESMADSEHTSLAVQHSSSVGDHLAGDSSSPTSGDHRSTLRRDSSGEMPSDTLAALSEQEAGTVDDVASVKEVTSDEAAASRRNESSSGARTKSADRGGSHRTAVGKATRLLEARARSEERTTDYSSVQSTSYFASQESSARPTTDVSTMSTLSMSEISDEEDGIYSGYFHEARWIYISTADERKLHTKIAHPTEAECGSSEGRMSRSSSIESTESERDFRRRYQAVTHRMVHRHACLQMLAQMDNSTFAENKTVVIEKTAGEFGFRIHGSRPVVVSAIEANTPADKSGLNVGDILVSVNGTRVLECSHSEVVRIAHSSHDQLTLQVSSCTQPGPGDNDPPDDPDNDRVTGHAGVLWRRSADGSWKRRWAVLRHDRCLRFYQQSQDTHPLSALSLLDANIRSSPDSDRPMTLSVSHDGVATAYLSASNEEELSTWISKLLPSTPSDPEALSRRVAALAATPAGQIPKPHCSGSLAKLGHGWRGWQRVHCVLLDGVLYMYRSAADISASGAVYLHGYRVQSSGGRRPAFELCPPLARLRHFYFRTDSEYDKKRWIAAMEYSIDRWIKVSK